MFARSLKKTFLGCKAEQETFMALKSIVILSETFLVVQWLGFCASTAGRTGSILGQGSKILHADHGAVCACVQSLSRIRLSVSLWTVVHQTPLSMGFSRQKYWSGLPFPSPGDLPDPGIESGSSTSQADALPSEPQGSPSVWQIKSIFTALKCFCTPLTHHPTKLCNY